MTWHQFWWCNRHFSYGQSADEAAADEEEGVTEAHAASSDDEESDDAAYSSQEELEEESEDDAEAEGEVDQDQVQGLNRKHDTFRKRREITDLACRSFSDAFNPGQHCGLDDCARPTKHWEKKRIRFKATVHSGTLVDMLNFCRTGYCLCGSRSRLGAPKILRVPR